MISVWRNLITIYYPNDFSNPQWQEARTQEDDDVYNQSYYAIKFLIDEYRATVLLDLIKSTGETGDFIKSLVQTTGMQLSDLETNY